MLLMLSQTCHQCNWNAYTPPSTYCCSLNYLLSLIMSICPLVSSLYFMSSSVQSHTWPNILYQITFLCSVRAIHSGWTDSGAAKCSWFPCLTSHFQFHLLSRMSNPLSVSLKLMHLLLGKDVKALTAFIIHLSFFFSPPKYIRLGQNQKQYTWTCQTYKIRGFLQRFPCCLALNPRRWVWWVGQGDADSAVSLSSSSSLSLRAKNNKRNSTGLKSSPQQTCHHPQSSAERQGKWEWPSVYLLQDGDEIFDLHVL